MFSRKRLFGVLCGGAVALLSLSPITFASAATLYVAPSGTATTRAQGTSSTTPFGSISVAVTASLSGDTIEVSPGTYWGRIQVDNKSNLIIQGKPNAALPVLKITKADSYNYTMVDIRGSINVTFQGFELNGEEIVNSSGTITNEGSGNACNAITIIPLPFSGSYKPNRGITISGNKVHHFGGGGIISGVDQTNKLIGNDYITISSNEIYNTNQTGPYNSSAISVLGTINSDTPGTAAYSSTHHFVQNNRIHDNVNRNKDLDSNGNIDISKHTDGNGIILDFNLANGPKTLVQGNLVYRNGGRGIHVFESGNVSVLNNSTYYNNLDPYLSGEPGELTAVAAQNAYFSNNVVHIAYVPGARETPVAFYVGDYYGSHPNANILFKNNTFTNGNPNPVSGAYVNMSNAAMDWNTTIFHDPSWGSLFVDPANNDFRLNLLATRSGLSSQMSQTARNRGSNASGDFAWYDFTWTVNRTVTPIPGGAIDRGAYEQ